MSFQDKTIQCSNCGTNFTFTASEQEFFQAKGFTNEPKRCPTCRQAKRSDRGNGGRGEMFPAVCAECSKETQVPFEPRGDKPVYCSDCYSKVRRAR
jgi:CxxC-x17-CxxC domain-containing protein